jgi:hypothetical protein
MGKVMPEPTPFLNEWWKVAFSVTPRGLTTDTTASGDEAFAIDFDFIDYNLFIHTSDGRTKALPLLPRSIADFYAEFLATLGVLGIEGAINPVPVEIPNPVRCDLDHHHGAYGPEHVHHWWRILVQLEQILQWYRALPSPARAARSCSSGARSTSPRPMSRDVRHHCRRERHASCSSQRTRKTSPSVSGRATSTTPG